ncbi:hypothetical protein [Desulfurobacterium atlanticum]|uniref:hypothetical protein n=1 Tax=Desulfurobacterium atlanticum TaxID=240169 RepID=UPI001C5F3C22|nr:hypothetical protein [Desulfurobacterium atlanticum]
MIVPFGTAHIFDYLDVVEKEVKKQAANIRLSKVDIFIDLLPIVGNREKTLFKFSYNKENGNIDWFVYEEFSIEEIPEHILEVMKKVYEEHKETLWEFLLPSEKKKFETVLSF